MSGFFYPAFFLKLLLQCRPRLWIFSYDLYTVLLGFCIYSCLSDETARFFVSSQTLILSPLECGQCRTSPIVVWNDRNIQYHACYVYSHSIFVLGTSKSARKLFLFVAVISRLVLNGSISSHFLGSTGIMLKELWDSILYPQEVCLNRRFTCPIHFPTAFERNIVIRGRHLWTFDHIMEPLFT